VPTDGPTFELIGELSDEAIEALAALLLSIHENEAKQASPVERASQEATS